VEVNKQAGPTGSRGEPLVLARHSWALVGLFLIAFVGAIIYARAILMPIVFAFLLAVTFTPIRRALSRFGIPSAVTAAGIVLSLLVLLTASVMGLSTTVRDYLENAPQLIAEAERKISAVTSTVETVTEAGERVEEMAQDTAEDAQTVVIKQPTVFGRMASTAPYLFAQIMLTLALLFFLLASGDMFYEKIVHALPNFADKRRAVQIFYDIEAKLSRYFLTITIVNAGLGVAIGLAMYLLGMPNPILFGVLGFVFNYVPYLGAIAGVIISTVIGILTFDTVGPALLAGFVYFFLTSFEGQFVTPYAVGKSLKLNTVVVFLAVAFWGWAWSIIGMIVALPTLIALKTFSEKIPHLRGLGYFLSARHAEQDADEAAEGSKVAQPAPGE
jgi:predicted PurR-regulated permease PerM